MSWQCVYCETINQDAVPVCTVCDRLAPVIESYLSLENIDCTIKYNEKLDLIHQLEENGEYEKMLETAVEAIALYKNNSLALKKAKEALKLIYEKLISQKLKKIIDIGFDSNQFDLVSGALNIWRELGLTSSIAQESENKLAWHLKNKKTIDETIYEVTQLILDYQPSEAERIIENVLDGYQTDGRLLNLRNKIRNFIQEQKRNNLKNVRKFPTSSKGNEKNNKVSSIISTEQPINLTSPRPKYPKIKRND